MTRRMDPASTFSSTSRSSRCRLNLENIVSNLVPSAPFPYISHTTHTHPLVDFIPVSPEGSETGPVAKPTGASSVITRARREVSDFLATAVMPSTVRTYNCSPIRYNIPYGPVTPNRGFLSRVHDIHEKLFPTTFIVTFVVSCNCNYTLVTPSPVPFPSSPV
jgi:hypothetical protein